jgi:hypothetical protein
MKKTTMLVAVLLLFVTGCSIRSISDSGYNPNAVYGHRSNSPFYKGELSEFDVLGIDAGKEVSDDDIASAVNGKKERLNIRKGDALLVIQSGAMIPDQDMTENLEKYFSINVFTGVPEQGKDSNKTYARALRLAAARAGIEKIVVYWGILESGTRNLATKTVSWVPVVGWAIPDKSQEVRIRLKVALIDVKSGQWEMFVPRAFEDTAYSGILSRESSDQAQVALLKAKAYRAAVDAIVAKCVR